MFLYYFDIVVEAIKILTGDRNQEKHGKESTIYAI